jgi:tRNA(Ile)-lysidine synthase
VSLLHALLKLTGVELTVAHFDHGIRSDSPEDRVLAASLAEEYGLPFMYEEGRLGPDASEAAAREARYDFLHRARRATGSRAIITAHHQDDVLETVIINVLRGTGRAGFSSLRDREDLRRPLLKISKGEILSYARANKLRWREDSTNSDETYLRNYIRRQVVPRFDDESKKRLLRLIEDSGLTNMEIDSMIGKLLESRTDGPAMNRAWFTGLPHDMSREIMAAWLRSNGLRDFDRKTLERLVVAGKTGRPGSRFDAGRSLVMSVGKEDLALSGMER